MVGDRSRSHITERSPACVEQNLRQFVAQLIAAPSLIRSFPTNARRS
jgi:hypothetical protein